MVARHFLCCLPLRLGALLISASQLVVVGLLAAGSWYTLNSMRGRLPSGLRGLIVSYALYYTLLSLIAIIGLFGSLLRKASLIGTYSYYLAYFTGIQIVLDAIYLYAFFSQSRETLIHRCLDGSTDQEVENICNDSFDTGKWTMFVSMVIGLIIQLWAAYIVASYAQKLKDEQAWRAGPGVAPPREAPGPKYAHVQEEDHIPLTGGYPYSDTNHSFGAPHSTTASV